MPDLNPPDFSQASGNTQMALQAPTDLQRQLDNYVANWNPENNAPFSYAGPGQLLPLLQGQPFQPPPLAPTFHALAPNANLFWPSSIFSPTYNAQGTGTTQAGLPGPGGNGQALGPPGSVPQFGNTLGGAPGAPMLGASDPHGFGVFF